MGYKGQLGLYLYYLLSAGALRQLSPPLALMTAQESSLSGGFRAAHQVCAALQLSQHCQLMWRSQCRAHSNMSQAAAWFPTHLLHTSMFI